MGTDRIEKVVLYDDAAAFTPKKGSTWFVSRRDWGDFDDFAVALRDSDIAFEREKVRAPFAARLQSYGLALDLMLIIDVIAVTVTLGIAMVLFH